MFVADDAFTLTMNMLKPYSKRDLSKEEKIFNYRLSRARRIIENCFGILAAKWRIYRTAINAKVVLVEQIIESTVCLHNWLRQHKNNNYFDVQMVDTDDNGNSTPGSWRQYENNFQLLPPYNTNCNRAAKETRIKYTTYFNGTGAVDWQDNMI